jgi:polar amino acid transport system substrate-binding protein
LDYHRRAHEKLKEYETTTWPDKKIIAMILILLVVASFFAVQKTMPILEKKKVLVMGTSTPFAPFEDIDNGQIVGFDIDLAREVARSMDMDLQIVDYTDFNTLFPALTAGKIDMFVAAATIKPDRQQAFNFSIPYYNASQAVLTLASSTFQCAGDCNSSDFQGFVVGYQIGTTSESWAQSNLLNTTLTNPENDFGNLLLLLKKGEINAVIVDSPVAAAYAKSDKAFKVAGIINTHESYGFVVQGGDPENLLPSINKALQDMMQSGQYDQFIQKWFK